MGRLFHSYRGRPIGRGPSVAGFPAIVETMAGAYSRYNEISNKAWLATTSAAFTAAFINPGIDGSVQFLGVGIDFGLFILLAVFVVAALNIHFCSCQMMCYELARDYATLLDDLKAGDQKITDNLRMKDLAYRLITPNYVRVFPLTFGMRPGPARIFMRFLKPMFDTIYAVVPTIGMVLLISSAYAAHQASFDPRSWTTYAVAVAGLFFALSVMATFLMLSRTLRWQRVMRGFTYSRRTVGRPNARDTV